MKPGEINIEEMKKKRTELLMGLWNYFLEVNFFDSKEVKLSYPLVNEIIEHYSIDCTILKYRYKIDDKIERSKIAGLMTALIMRYRPINLLTNEVKSKEALCANETFAIIYGLAVCFEDSLYECMKIVQMQWFHKWFDEFKYLLHVRHYTAESLAFIFKTLRVFLKTK